MYRWCVLSRRRGAFRDRHERGAGCGGRGSVDKTNDAGCGRRSRVVLTPRRWRQARQAIDERRWQKSPVTGESTKEAVKTIARGRPGEPGEPVVTNSSCFIYFAREAAGASSTRLSLRPLFRGRSKYTTRALIAPRDRGRVFVRLFENRIVDPRRGPSS